MSSQLVIIAKYSFRVIQDPSIWQVLQVDSNNTTPMTLYLSSAALNVHQGFFC